MPWFKLTFTFSHAEGSYTETKYLFRNLSPDSPHLADEWKEEADAECERHCARGVSGGTELVETLPPEILASEIASCHGWIKSARSRLSGILKVEDPIQTLENRLKMASRFDLGDFYILREDDGSYTLRDAEAHYIYDSREPLRYKSGCVNGDAFHYESRSDAENPEWLKATRRTLDELFRMWEAPGTKEDNADGY